MKTTILILVLFYPLLTNGQTFDIIQYSGPEIKTIRFDKAKHPGSISLLSTAPLNNHLQVNLKIDERIRHTRLACGLGGCLISSAGFYHYRGSSFYSGNGEQAVNSGMKNGLVMIGVGLAITAVAILID